jgi:two-component system response regulator DesR
MLVDDNLDFRSLMEALLSGQSDLEVVAQAGSLAEARGHTAKVEVDVAVLDLGLPDGNGVDLIADLRRENAGVAVMILSSNVGSTSAEEAMHAGADDCLDKFAPLDQILGTIRRLGGE